MYILHVIPIARSLETEVLSYFSVKKVSSGTMVTVPLRKKKIHAIVLDTLPVSDLKSQLRGASYQLRNISEIHEVQIFSSAFLKTAQTIKNFYATTTGKILNTTIPAFLLKDLSSFNRVEHIQSNPSFHLRILQRPLNERIDYYKTLFREKMFHDQSLHIVCPTRDHSEYIFNQLKKNNEAQCFLFHGGMTKKKFSESYAKLASLEKSSLIISTPNFVDIPQYHTSTLVIEHESSDYYRQIPAPYLDMRYFLQEYAKNAGYECICADGIIRPESWVKVQQGHAEPIEPFHKKIFKEGDLVLTHQSKKIAGKQSDIERHKELTKDKKFQTLSDEARQYIKDGILQKEKIFLFVHKKSLAPTVVCQDCGNIVRSPDSGYPFSLYTRKNSQSKKTERIFICHMTGETIPAFDTCQFCKSWRMIPMGIGAQKVHEEITKLFPKTKVLLLDGKHTPTKKKQQELRKEFQESKKSVILIGTSMAVDTIPNFDRSVIVSLDSYFARMSYSIHQQVLGIIKTLCEKTIHPLFIQSRNILDEALSILTSGMYPDYIETELAERKDYRYPPFATLCVISKIVKKEQVKTSYQNMHQLFKIYDPQIIIQPTAKKGVLQVIVVLQLDQELWNLGHQDPKLQERLYSFDRNTTIHINPKNILS